MIDKHMLIVWLWCLSLSSKVIREFLHEVIKVLVIKKLYEEYF